MLMTLRALGIAAAALAPAGVSAFAPAYVTVHSPCRRGRVALVADADAAHAVESIRQLVTERGRCSLAEAGEHLRASSIELPSGVSLSELLSGSGGDLRLSGRPSHRLVSLATETTEAALVRLCASVVQEYGPIGATELKARLSERGRYVPGLRTLLRNNAGTFEVSDASVVSLRADADAGAAGPAPAPLVRLRTLGLARGMDDLPPSDRIDEVIFCDMDNKASMLEPSAARASRRGPDDECRTLVLAFSATTHNPRVSAGAAAQMSDLARRGWLRLLSPAYDTKNAADFVLTFWMGWLHRELPKSATFVVVSTDIHLEGTALGLLKAEGRPCAAVARPDELRAPTLPCRR